MARNQRRLGFAFCCIVGSWLNATAAQAYVCARVPDANNDPTGPSNAWLSRKVSYAFNQSGTSQMTNDQAWGAIRKSFAVWTGNPPASSSATGTPITRPNVTGCQAGTTDFVFDELAPTSQSFTGYNFLDPNSNMNIIVFRDTAWSHPSTAGDTIALTTTTYNALTGEIFDADIEFNSKNFVFTVDPTDVQFDLMNTASHEIGHFLGFAHSLDANATMYGSAPKGETTKGYLSCDDVAIMLFRYPSGNGGKVGYCDPPQDACVSCALPSTDQFIASVSLQGINDGRGGCTCSTTDARASAWWLAALGACIVGRIRRKQI